MSVILLFTLMVPVYGGGDDADAEGKGSGGIYLAGRMDPLRIGSWFSENNPNFVVANGDMIRSGHVELGADPFFHMGAAIGHRMPLTRNVSFRAEYGVSKMRWTMDSAVYDRFDFDQSVDLATVNASIKLDGDQNSWGPHIGGYLDFALGEDSDKFIYLGTSVAWLNTDLSYNLNILDFDTSLDDMDMVRAHSYEAGAIVGLTDTTSLQLAYEWTQLDASSFMTNRGSTLDIRKFNRHTFKLGFIHWVSRR